jgi:Rps23 Pro-64 3,4-dihydroxylase Tpa1-like proline 4-hydroxylase
MRLIQEASSPRFLAWLTALTGEQALVPDPYLQGGGVHQIGSGGFLKVHADFNWSERLQLYRRLNLLLYLNPDWQPQWGGALELWNEDMSACITTILPEANTMVVFTTDDRSFHGHPHPLACPEYITRDSIALYYYSPLRPAANWAARRKITDYRPIPGDTFKPGKPKP